MRIRSCNVATCSLILVVLFLGVVTNEARAASPSKMIDAPKTVKLAFVNASWREVFTWLTKHVPPGPR